MFSDSEGTSYKKTKFLVKNNQFSRNDFGERLWRLSAQIATTLASDYEKRQRLWRL